jgi:acetyl esterase
MSSGPFLNTEDFASPTLDALATDGTLKSDALHPTTQALMRRMARYGGLTERISVPYARRRIQTMMTLVATKPPVQSVTDRTVSGPGGPVRVRIVTPATGAAPRPALIWFPGGGFVLGDLTTAEPTARSLASRLGAVVVCVDYRKAPEHTFDDGYNDAAAVVRWVFRNAVGLGIDPARIGVGGDSAGGNLAAVAALEHAPDLGPLALQLLVYPAVSAPNEPARLRNAEGGMLDLEALRWFEMHIAGAVDPDSTRHMPLVATDLSGLPPSIVVTAGHDPLRDEGIVYLDRLRAAGVRAEHLHYADDIHGFFSMDLVLANAVDALDATADLAADILGLDEAARPAAGSPNALRADLGRRLQLLHSVLGYGVEQLLHMHFRARRQFVRMLGLPAARDVDALNNRIARLEQQIRSLRRQLEHQQHERAAAPTSTDAG